MSDIVARETYRHIRIALVVAAFALAASVAYEHLSSAGPGSTLCWQGSVSAYYWTPVHAIFIGSLIAIGVSMIALTTYGPYENMFLNLAGMMAPLVALIPPHRPEGCAPSRPIDLSVGFDIANNAFAFFLGAAAAIATTLLIVSIVHDTPSPVTVARRRSWQIQMAVVTGVLVGLALWHFVIKRGFTSFAHPVSAVLMFGFIFVVVVINARKCTARKRFRTLYRAVQWFMIGSVVLLLGTKAIVSVAHHTWDHFILLIEIAMIVAFAAFWVLQTTELWDAEPGLPSTAPAPSPEGSSAAGNARRA